MTQRGLVLSVGQVIDGKEIDFIAQASYDLNNNGEVVADVGFTNGNFALVLATPITAPTFTCSGYGPPADNPLSIKKPNRVLSLRMQLFDSENNAITDADITSPPVLEIDFLPLTSEDVFDDVILSPGKGDAGN